MLKDVDPNILNKMNEGEKINLTCLQLLGHHQYNKDGTITVMSGMNKFKKLDDFISQMNEKYNP